MKTPEQVLKVWLEAFNTRNAVLGASVYHEDAEVTQLAFGTPLKGREAIYQDLKQFFEHNPDNETHLVNMIVQGEWLSIEWSGKATFYLTPDTPGKYFELRGCGFFHVIDGKIKTQRGYFDKATWFKQVGLPLD